jgi:hypothetical protein
MLVPSNKEAYFNLQGSVPVSSGESMVGNIFFNEALNSPSQGSLDWGTSDPSDDVLFSFPHDQWFRITMLFDINAGMAFATWVMWIDDLPVVPYGTPLSDGNGTIPSSLGGVNYFSISMDNDYFLDDFQFSNGPLDVTEENETPRFSMYPNPTQDELNIVFEGEIEEVRLYDLNARLLVQGVSEKVVDVSRLSAGLYFIELLTTNGKSVQKFIKE